MSAQRNTGTEAFALVRPRESHASWFAMPVRHTTPSTLLELEPEPEMILVRASGEPHPAAAGLCTGALAGAAMLAAATAVARSFHVRGASPIATIADLFARGASAGTRIAVAWSAVAVAGAVIGALFAWMTRRLRKLAPLLAFGTLLSTATWTVVHALALPRVAPQLARALPFGPMVIGAMVFGLVVAMQLPLRARRLT